MDPSHAHTSRQQIVRKYTALIRAASGNTERRHALVVEFAKVLQQYEDDQRRQRILGRETDENPGVEPPPPQ